MQAARRTAPTTGRRAAVGYGNSREPIPPADPSKETPALKKARREWKDMQAQIAANEARVAGLIERVVQLSLEDSRAKRDAAERQKTAALAPIVAEMMAAGIDKKTARALASAPVKVRKEILAHQKMKADLAQRMGVTPPKAQAATVSKYDHVVGSSTRKAG